MARPKKAPHEKRTERPFNPRFTVAEVEYIRTQADAAGISTHEYMRRRAMGYAISPARSSATDPALINEINRIGVNVNQLALAVHRGSEFQHHWKSIGDDIRAMLKRVLQHGA